MWSAQSVIYYSAPVVVTAGGVYLLYRATQLANPAADKAFALGMILIFASWGFTAARSSRQRSRDVEQVATDNCRLTRRVRQLERRHEDLRHEVDSKFAVKAWLEAFDRSEAHHSTSWVQLRKND